MKTASWNAPVIMSALSRISFRFLYFAALAVASANVHAAITIRSAVYDDARKQLTVDIGLGSKASRSVSLFNHRTDELLLEKNVRGKDVRLVVRKITGNQVPCEVRAESGGASDVSSVDNSPAECDGGPPPGNQPPECAILDGLSAVVRAG